MRRLFFPSKSQWRNWKLQSKLSLVGAYIVIFSTLISFLIYSGNLYRENNRIHVIKTTLIKHEWTFNNFPSFARYEDLITTSKLKEIESEFGMKFKSILLLVGSMMSNGLVTYEFFSDNTYKFNVFGDKNVKKEKFEIIKENSIFFLVLKPESPERKEKFAISEITDDKLVLIKRNEEFNIDVEYEYRPINN